MLAPARAKFSRNLPLLLNPNCQLSHLIDLCHLRQVQRSFYELQILAPSTRGTSLYTHNTRVGLPARAALQLRLASVLTPGARDQSNPPPTRSLIMAGAVEVAPAASATAGVATKFSDDAWGAEARVGVG